MSTEGTVNSIPHLVDRFVKDIDKNVNDIVGGKKGKENSVVAVSGNNGREQNIVLNDDQLRKITVETSLGLKGTRSFEIC